MDVFNSFLIALNAVIPIACLMGLGWCLVHFKVIDREFARKGNKWAFSAFLPVTFFNTLRKANFGASFRADTLLYIIIALLVCSAIGFILGAFVIKTPNQKGVFAQAVIRTNVVVFGLPIAKSIYDISELTTMVLALAIAAPLLNLLSVVALGVYPDEESGHKVKVDIKQLLLSIIKNPIIVGTVLGAIVNVVFNRFDITMYPAIDSVLTTVGGLATPILLIFVGALLTFDNLKKYSKIVTGYTALRLIILPLAVTLIAIAFGMRGVDLAVTMLMFATPAPVATVGMAAGQKKDSVLAGLLVAVPSLISVVTIFLFIFILRLTSMI